MNPYEAPAAAVADSAGAHAHALAGRADRFAAALLDAVILLAVMLPLMIVGGYWRTAMDAAALGQRPGVVYMLMWVAIGFGVFLAVQGVPLARSGQTWGKKVCRIRIADLGGRKPPFLRLVLLRYLPVQLVSAIPVVGMLVTFADVLFVFGHERRCLHDRVAGTRVLRAD